VDDTLRKTLVVKMGNFLPQDKILQQRRAAIARAQGVLIVADAYSLVGGQGKIFAAFTEGLQSGELLIMRIGGLKAAGGGWLLSRRGGAGIGAVGVIFGGQGVKARSGLTGIVDRGLMAVWVFLIMRHCAHLLFSLLKGWPM